MYVIRSTWLFMLNNVFGHAENVPMEANLIEKFALDESLDVLHKLGIHWC